MSRFKSRSDFILVGLLRVCAVISALLVSSIIFFLWSETRPVLQTVPLQSFFKNGFWSPSEGQYSLAPMIAASLLTTLIAIGIAGPIGVFAAIFSHLFARGLIRNIYRICIGVLAGIPSVVFGFWGLIQLVPLVNRWHPPGASLLTGSLVLAIMIVPTVALLTEASFASVPRSTLHGAYALGMSRLGLFRSAIFPYCRSGVVTAVLLAAGRAIGETMAMVMVCGNIVQFPDSLFDPVRTLPANIALEMAYATGLHRSALFWSGLLLILIVTGLIVVSQIIPRKLSHENHTIEAKPPL